MGTSVTSVFIIYVDSYHVDETEKLTAVDLI